MDLILDVSRCCECWHRERTGWRWNRWLVWRFGLGNFWATPVVVLIDNMGSRQTGAGIGTGAVAVADVECSAFYSAL